MNALCVGVRTEETEVELDERREIPYGFLRGYMGSVPFLARTVNERNTRSATLRAFPRPSAVLSRARSSHSSSTTPQPPRPRPCPALVLTEDHGADPRCRTCKAFCRSISRTGHIQRIKINSNTPHIPRNVTIYFHASAMAQSGDEASINSARLRKHSVSPEHHGDRAVEWWE